MAEQNFRLDYQRNTTDAPAFCCVVCTRTFIFHADEFSFYSSSYCIESVSKGQYEAGQVLGMTKTQIFFKIILLQVIKRIIPPLSNEVITLTKDTSLARIIGLAEIIMCAERFTKQGLIWPLFSTAVFFLVFNGILTILFGWIEKKMDYFRV